MSELPKNDAEVASNVSAQILKVIEEREELAYEAGVKDTLSRVLPQLKQINNLVQRNIDNIEATLAMDRLVNLAKEEEAEKASEE
jgi:hypothetical protein